MPRECAHHISPTKLYFWLRRPLNATELVQELARITGIEADILTSNYWYKGPGNKEIEGLPPRISTATLTYTGFASTSTQEGLEATPTERPLKAG